MIILHRRSHALELWHDVFQITPEEALGLASAVGLVCHGSHDKGQTVGFLKGATLGLALVSEASRARACMDFGFGI